MFPIVAYTGEAVARLTGLLKAQSPATRFLACKCLTALAPALPSTSAQHQEVSSCASSQAKVKLASTRDAGQMPFVCVRQGGQENPGSLVFGCYCC